jgi:RNA polymerase sigma-70 factor (ECF subfamily)
MVITGEHRIVVERSAGRGPAVGPRREQVRARFVSGDPDAFDELARPHLNALYTLCLRVVGNEQEAEDLAQLALVKALEARHRFDSDRAFKPWLFQITLNVCRDRLRTVWWSRILPLNKAPQETQPSPELRTEAAQRDAMVRHALSTLPRKYREAVALFHLEDMSYADMSEITGASVPALKQRVRRGLEMLGHAVRRMYPELAQTRTEDEHGAAS